MVIKTERCLIRPFQEADMDAFMAYRNNLDWMRYQGFKGLEKQAYIEQMVDRFSIQAGVQLAIVCDLTNAVIGDIYLKQEEDCYWIGCTISPEKAWQGYAYEAVCAVLRTLAADANRSTCVKAGVMSGNTASMKLLEKLHFQYLETEGDAQVFVLHLDAAAL